MDYMRSLPDNAFELAIVDPPYGINYGKSEGFKSVKRKNGTTGHASREKHDKKNWDEFSPSPEYFSELFRVSKIQIIWGGNYFDLPPTRGVICWDKKQPFENFSAWEMAWTNTDKPAAMFRYDNKGFMCNDGAKIHPTQKPVKLYQWLLSNYAKPGDRILDTHLGSGSSAIAAHYAGHDFVGIELDENYFKAAKKRFDELTKQEALF
jgi:site-specific DNA-methyltransferase (adenine-specific)